MVRVTLFGVIAVVLLTLMGTQQASTTPAATSVSDCSPALLHALDLLKGAAGVSPYADTFESLTDHALIVLRAVADDPAVCARPTQACPTTITLTPDTNALAVTRYSASVWNRHFGCIKFLVGPVGSEPFPTAGGLNFVTLCRSACIKTFNQGLTYWNGLGQEGGDTAIYNADADVLIHELGHQLGYNDSPHDCKCNTGSPLCVMDSQCLSAGRPWLTIR